MVYCDQDMCESKLGRLMQAFRADRPSEWQMDEFIGMAEQMHKEIERLRQAEKDAARYRWLMENCGKILEPARNRTHLYLPNYCPLSMDYVDVSKHIDEAMQCNK